MKRVFDVVSSIFVLLLGLPFFILISVIIVFDGKGGPFFVQQRVGKNNVDFGLIKFRTMKPNAESSGQITVGERDPRITKIGYFLRKFKIDEFPQLINVIAGQMSIVGPRPEVRRYVDMYNHEQLKVLIVRPGLTDYASLEYIDENKLLGESQNPDETYIKQIMPDKLKLNLKYIREQSMKTDLKIIFKTFSSIFR